MSTISNRLKRSAALAVAATSLAVSAVSHADYRLAVFDDARAFTALSEQDAATARSIFKRRASLPLDYADMNNLCVLRIMEREVASAEGVCQKAYFKVNEKSMRLREKRRTRAVILANLAVAQMLNGSIADAQESLAKAQELDADNPNVAFNREAFARNQLAANR